MKKITDLHEEAVLAGGKAKVMESVEVMAKLMVLFAQRGLFVSEISDLVGGTWKFRPHLDELYDICIPLLNYDLTLIGDKIHANARLQVVDQDLNIHYETVYTGREEQAHQELVDKFVPQIMDAYDKYSKR